ncbi:MAG: DUF1566 domain-containing protein [Limnohabitans sp.]|nr:DUF1566 domain-containing protein [Limnohabitans sp.]
MKFPPQSSVLAASFLASTVLQAACFPDMPLTRPDSRYEAADASGSEVKDKETGLIWQRCVYGLKWGITACSGTAIAQDWKTATKTAGDAKWRLPTQAELEGLSEKSCSELAMNKTWFGSGPSGWTWTATDMGSPDGAVVVHSGSSLIANLIKKLPLYVRWVHN